MDTEDRQRLPPLIAKVALVNRRGGMAREAWFYDELWPLQGVAIPLCFGWFETEISSTDDVWSQLNVPLTCPLSPVYPGQSLEDVSRPPHDGRNLGEAEDSPPIEGRLAEIGAVTTKISILLIERLGRHYLPKPKCEPYCKPDYHQHYDPDLTPEV